MKSQKPPNRYYRGAKISEFRFRRVLWGFACDLPVTALAQRMTLSTNSASAIYQRLRAHYVRIGVFRSFYDDPDEQTEDTSRESYERALLEFHFGRLSRMRGIKPDQKGTDNHFRESCWRFQLVPFFEGRAADTVHKMAFNELLTYLIAGGPVGGKVPDLLAVKQCQMEILDRRAAWLERNSSDFKSDELRASLRETRQS